MSVEKLKRTLSFINEVFTKVYYVNVDHHTERNEKFRKRLGLDVAENAKIQRINAVKPGSSEVLSEKNDDLLFKIFSNRKNKIDYPWRHSMPQEDIRLDHLHEVCCSLSHAKLLQTALDEFKASDDKEHIVLALEDDSFININKLDSADLLGIVYEDYDICYVGSVLFHDNLSGWLTERSYHIDCSVGLNTYNLWNADSGFFGTHGYVVKINRNNIKKIEALISELSSGSIADFCLSSQPYLKKKTVQNFFVEAVETSSTINDTSAYVQDILIASNPDLKKLGLVKGLQAEHGDSKSLHPFINRLDAARQTWVYVKYKNHPTYKKVKFSNDEIDKDKQFISSLIGNQAIDKAYSITYNSLVKIWYGEKTYIVK
jgi:GR25 family glycosyltransferase involved in LPS biosynthesis